MMCGDGVSQLASLCASAPKSDWSEKLGDPGIEK